MRLLLTGSSGFVGSYFVEKYSDRYDINKFSFLNDDFEELCLDDIDVVVHLSAFVHQMNGAAADAYEKVNVAQTVDLAQKAKRAGVKQFLFMSTVKVYGEERDEAYLENSVCTPKDEYGKSKLKAEQKLLELEDKGFKIGIIRTPIVYGYGVKANIKNLIDLVKKAPLLPFGEIENRRSMVFLGNLCHLIDEIIVQDENGVFLASDDKPLSTTRFIELIAKSLDKRIILVKIPFFESLLKFFKPSFHKRLYDNLEVNNQITKHKLNLKNPYSTEFGINEMIKKGNS